MKNYNENKFKISIKRSDIIFILLLYFTIVDSLGAFQAKPLSSASFKHFLIITKYIDLFLISFVLFSKPVKIYSSILVPISYYLSTHLHVYDSSAFNYDLLLFGFLIIFFIVDDETKERLYDAVCKYMVFVSAVGIICYISYIAHLGIPYKVTNYYFGDDLYINYYLCYLITGYSKVVRLCGLFIEPGLFGTLLALIICSKGINFKNISIDIMLLAGVLTFSLAFVYTLAIYMLLNYFRNKKQIIILLVVFVITIAIISNISSLQISYNNIIARLFSNDSLNRTSARMDVWFSDWLKSSKIFFGYGIGYYDFTGTLSFKQELLKFGIIGFLFEYGLLLYDSIKKCNKNINALIFVFLFFINIYQRPEIYVLIILTILYGGIIKLTKENNENKDLSLH